MATSAPRRASSTAMPWPIPIPAPVTSAFFPDRSLTGPPLSGRPRASPSLAEEVEVDVLLGMGFDDFFVQLDAEAGSLRELEIAVRNLGEAWGGLADPGVG